jgi:xanthine/uracil permease
MRGGILGLMITIIIRRGSMDGLVKPTVIIIAGAFMCAIGVLLTLWLLCNRGFSLPIVLSGSFALIGIFTMVMGIRMQGIELYLQDFIERRDEGF